MEDFVFGVENPHPAAFEYDWTDLLSQFPLEENERMSLLRENYEPDFNVTRFSQKYSIYYSDFDVVIRPTIFSEFPNDNIFSIYVDILDDCLARSLRAAASPQKRPFERVKLSFKFSDDEDMNPLNTNFVNLDQMTAAILLDMLAGLIHSQRDEVESSNFCHLSLTYI